MKKLFVALVLMPLMAFAETETVDGVEWTYTIIDGKAQIGTVSSSSRAISSDTVGAITIPSMLGKCPVTSIGDYAFYFCSKLTSVTIPEGVTRIGNSAFSCCSSLTMVDIPSSVVSVGSHAFTNTKLLNEHANGFVILEQCLLGYKGVCLGNIVIPNGVRVIADQAFYNCEGLTGVVIPSSVMSVGNCAFSGCLGVTALTIPSSVISIGEMAFQNCNWLQVVFVENEPQACVRQCFGDQMWYQKINTPINYEWECSYSNGEAVITGVRPAFGSIIIPSEWEGFPVMSIGDSAFAWCNALTSVIIPEGVATISANAFLGCRCLQSVTIPSSTTGIGDWAFEWCEDLSTMTIPSSVTSLGEGVFIGCTNLTLKFEGSCPGNYIGSGIVDVKKAIFHEGYEYTYPTVKDALNEFGISVSAYIRGLNIHDYRNNGYNNFVQISGSVYFEKWSENGRQWMSCPSWIKFGVNGIHFENDSITFGYEGMEFTAISDNGTSFCLCSDVFVSDKTGTYYSGVQSIDSVVLKSDNGPFKMGECVALRKIGGSVNYCQVGLGSDKYGVLSWYDYGVFHKGVFYCKLPGPNDSVLWNWDYQNLHKFKTWFLNVDCGTGSIEYSLEIEPVCKSYRVEFDVALHAPYSEVLRQYTTGIVSDPYTNEWYSINIDENDSAELAYELESRDWSVEEYYGDGWGGTYETVENVATRHYQAGFDVDLGWHFVGWRLQDGNVKDSNGDLLPRGSFIGSVQGLRAESDVMFVAVYEPIAYGITFEDVKGCENANTNAYTVEDEIVFSPLPDLMDWHFDGWSPETIPVGSTGDVTVTALWRPIVKAEIVGGWSEPQTFEYDGQAHGVAYSARLDVMDWPLNVVTQGTIRAVNVGEYAATARAETVGVPETDTICYRCAAVTNECRWTIMPKPVTKLQITYVSTAMIANGQPQTPQIEVRDVERGVVQTSADYKLAYENNVGPGKGVARITGKGNYGGETTIEFPIVSGVSPSEGLNVDVGTFEIVGETDWVADNIETHDGYASMRSGTIGDGEESALTAVVHGAGTVSFWWKVSSQRFDSVLELDRLEFYIDGERQKWINGDTLWTKVSYKVDGAGPHELKWVYVKDDSISEGLDCGWVDEVAWEKEWLIGDWLNDVDREFITEDGDSFVKWTPDSSVNADGVGSMRSGTCQQGRRSILSTVVENAGELTFKWKSSCVAYGSYITDKLSLLVDGVPVKDKDGKDIFINGQTDWLDVSYRISGVGRHEVQWVFEKVSDASMGQDCGWVDVVHWNGEPGTLTDADLVVDAFDGIYDGQGHGVEVSVTGAQNATVKYGISRDAIDNTASPMFADCGEHEVWFAVNVPEFNEYVGKTVVRIRPRSIETGEVTLGKSLVYAGAVLTQTVSSVVVDGLAATFEVAGNEAREAGAYRLTVSGIGNFCGALSVPFAIAQAQASLKDVVVEGVSSETGAVEFTYDGKSHLPVVVVGYDTSAVVRFSLSEEGPYADELAVSNAVERLEVWYEISSANYARLVGRTQMTIHPLSIEKAEVVLGEQVSDVEGRVVQLVDSVIVDGLSATFDVADNVVVEVGDFELTVSGTGNFTGKTSCPYSVGGIVLPPVLSPGDGTVFTNAQIVRFSVQTPGSKCYYTLDGSMPTTNSLSAGRVNLHEKTTIRAIAVLDGKLRSAVVEARYALGVCGNPKIRLDGLDGEVFHFPGQRVVIDWDGEEGVVRYTLDGSEPTPESPIYEGPFAISETTTIKAKALSDSYFDSETVTADMRLEVLTVPTPVIQSAGEYCGTKTKIAISCALDGAVIRYTLDGSEPTAASALYEGEFEIGGKLGSSISVKARAFCDSYADSSVAEAVVTRVWGIGDALGVPDMAFTTDGWVVDAQERLDGYASMRSGQTGDGETKTLETVVQGGGTIAFFWRTSCEDSDGDFIWDRAEFWVDDVCIAKLEGESEWLSVIHEIPDDKDEHRLRWLYVKDPEPEMFAGEDCAWVSEVSWRPSDEALARPAIEGDEGATVTGDAEKGFVIKPSDGNKAVEVTIPQGVDAAKVMVEVSPKVASVKPKGAKVKVVSSGADITAYLEIPGAMGCDDGSVVATQPDGVIDLTKAAVKEEIVKETLDVEKGAVIDLCGGSQGTASPVITTAPTRVGLFYTFCEGRTLGEMERSASKPGDGKSWSPEIKIKGGNSAFYSIGVGKGE